ncbi:hypothetical protein EPN95_02205 [Patescibacteria group bacterium]|nr:MAG: hypothetical protein EPN95_02205 [Patescibacteria group bacterium]
MSIFTSLAITLTNKDVNIPNGSANQVLDAGLNIIYFIAGLVAVVMIIISGYTLVTNGGEPEAVKKARNTILYAVIGLVIVFTAFAVTWFFIGRIHA